MGMAFYYAPYGQAQWRGPLGIALIFPFMMLLIVVRIPISGRAAWSLGLTSTFFPLTCPAHILTLLSPCQALPLVPESPRFLLMRNRVEEAREVTMKLHSIKGDPDQEFARAEFYQMEKQASSQQGWHEYTRLTDIVSGGI